MRIFSITVALLVSAALYLLIFERDRLMSFSQLKPTPDGLKNEILIRKRELKEIATVIWLTGVPFPFIEKRPPPAECTWAGVLHLSGFPWKVWEYCEEQKKDSWRKV